MKFWQDIQSLLEQIFFYESLIRIAGCVVVIFLSLALRKLFVKFVVSLLKRVTGRTKTDFDDKLVEALVPPVQFIFVIIGIWIGAKILNLEDKADIFVNKVINSLIAFSIFWAAYRASDIITGFFKKITDKTETKLDDMLLPFLRNSLKVIVVVFGAITVVQQWNKDITGILTGLGLGGLAFALAAKDTASNLFGSIMIMIDRPFAIGDWILTPHVEGTVEDIGFRSTKVRTFAQALVTIPNSVMSNDPITNWSRMGKRRITFRLGVTYNTSSEQMKECVKRLRQMLENHPEVHPQTIFVYFERFGDSALEIFLYLFTKTTNWQKFLEVQEDINLGIMDILKGLGLSVAFPSRSIYVEQVAEKLENERKIEMLIEQLK